jgi:hypothetical protein
MRNSRSVRVAAGALMLAAPSTAVALASGQQAHAQGALQIDVNARHFAYGDVVKVNGTGPKTTAGHRVLLEFARAGAANWQTLSAATIGPNGGFRLSAPMRKSGSVRAVSTAPQADASQRPATPANNTGGASLASAARKVSVRPQLRLAPRSIDVLGGQSFTVQGRLLPGVAGRRVRLEELHSGRWQVIASAHTGSKGGFGIRYRPWGAFGAGGRGLRVAFDGDRQNTHTSKPAGHFTVFNQSVASWYYDAGNTACGYHAGLGVANKYLPCGTKVTFRYGGRSVTATVDDRGPYVGGRTWDLNQTTAAALGFAGVGTVWATS